MNTNEININSNGGNLSIDSSAIGTNNSVNQTNRINDSIKNDIGTAVAKISAYVAESKNEAAVLLLSKFEEELNSPQSDESKMKQYWDGLQEILPGLANLADTCAKIAELFI